MSHTASIFGCKREAIRLAATPGGWPHRHAVTMTERACHVVSYALQFDLIER
jgi:hypothetical protein